MDKSINKEADLEGYREKWIDGWIDKQMNSTAGLKQILKSIKRDVEGRRT